MVVLVECDCSVVAAVQLLEHSLCTNFVRDALAFRFVNLKHVATDRQFADVLTKAPTAPMLRLLKTLMDGAAKIPLLARLYQ